MIFKGTNTMNVTKTLAAVAALTTATSAVASSITVDNVAQRWPWNNKIDITYTVSGGQDVSLGVFARIVFTAHIGGTDYTIDGVHDIGASASDGQHTVTWTVPTGIRASGCTVTAQLLSADNPSGDDYMVVDLDTGTVSYEGLLATQDDSNARYNGDATYKTTKLVLRKVPAWAARSQLPNASTLSSLTGYPTGHSAYNSSSSATLKNSPAYWQTTRDFYIGVFPVTQRQYTKIFGTNPSYYKSDITGNLAAHRPVETVSWNELRTSGTAPSEAIPAGSSASSGTFFQRLNFMTDMYFDLPTEIMAEIAQRAGSRTKFPWGDSADTSFAVTKSDKDGLMGGSLKTVAVGSKKPNSWGLYDTTGDVFEVCLDDTSRSDLASAPDPFTPASDSASSRIARCGGEHTKYFSDNTTFCASDRTSRSPSEKNSKYGFRVAFIVP